MMTSARWLGAVAIATSFACAGAPDAVPGVSSTTGDSAAAIARVGVFNVGGELVQVHEANVDGSESGTIWANQLLVRYLLPAPGEPRPPIVMLPGYGLASDIYLETPDGREGWAMQFVRSGHPVYLVEPAQSTRAGINPEVLNAQIRGRKGPRGRLFTWTRELSWRRFGLGESEGAFFADSQMDPGSFDELAKMLTPTVVPEVDGEAMIAAGLPYNLRGLRQLFDRVGPSILLVHSAAGVTGFAFAAENSDDVLAVVNIEPVGCPAADTKAFPDVPVLSMFADHMEVRPQMPLRQQECQQVVDALKARGVPAAMFALPAMGIAGNSHFPMSERNSANLAALVEDWLKDNVTP